MSAMGWSAAASDVLLPTAHPDVPPLTRCRCGHCAVEHARSPYSGAAAPTYWCLASAHADEGPPDCPCGEFVAALAPAHGNRRG